MRVKNKYFSITPDVAEKMQKVDITSVILRQRLASGWEFEDAIEAPIGVRRSEWESLKPKENDITKGKTPTEVQHELRNLGVKGFIVGMTSRKLKMKVKREDIKSNRKCLR